MNDEYKGIIIIDANGNIDYGAITAYTNTLTVKSYIGNMAEMAQAIMDTGKRYGDSAKAILLDATYRRYTTILGNSGLTRAKYNKSVTDAIRKAAQATAMTMPTVTHRSRQYIPDCPVDIDTGAWVVDMDGVHRTRGECTVYAATTPIVITDRMADVDTHAISLRIAYLRPSGKWEKITVPKADTADIRKITPTLAALDCGVTALTAPALVEYLACVYDLNNTADIHDAVSHLGATDDWSTIMPYCPGNTLLSPDISNSTLVKHYGIKGNADVQIDALLRIRCYNPKINPILMDAALTSMCLPLLSGQTYIINPFGVTTAGKSAMAAVIASLYGFCGRQGTGLLQNYDGSKAGQEGLLVKLGNLPLIYEDEKSKDDDSGHHAVSPYFMCGGRSRLIRLRTGGERPVMTWCLAIYLPSEYAICDGDSASGGAEARVINIDCDVNGKPSVDVDGADGEPIQDTLHDTLYNNYGHPAQILEEALLDDDTRITLRNRYKEIRDYITHHYHGAYNRKHVEVVASVVATSELCDQIIWHTGHSVAVEDMIPYIKTQRKISESTKMYDTLTGWMATHETHFTGAEAYGTGRDTWGTIKDDVAVVTKAALTAMCKDFGWFYSDFSRSIIKGGYAIPNRSGKFEYNARISKHSTPATCMCIRLGKDTASDTDAQGITINTDITLAPAPDYVTPTIAVDDCDPY